jgi:hypothetical protein
VEKIPYRSSRWRTALRMTRPRIRKLRQRVIEAFDHQPPMSVCLSVCLSACLLVCLSEREKEWVLEELSPAAGGLALQMS